MVNHFLLSLSPYIVDNVLFSFIFLRLPRESPFNQSIIFMNHLTFLEISIIIFLNIGFVNENTENIYSS